VLNLCRGSHLELHRGENGRGTRQLGVSRPGAESDCQYGKEHTTQEVEGAQRRKDCMEGEKLKWPGPTENVRHRAVVRTGGTQARGLH